MRKNLSIILTISTAACGILAYELNIEKNYLILLASVFLLIILLLFEHFETKSGKGIEYSIFDKFKGLFNDRLKNPERNKFKGRFENLLLVSMNENNSIKKITEIQEYYKNETQIKPEVFLIEIDSKKIEEEKDKESFQKKIKSSDGVIFIRSKEFDKHSWIIDTIDDWAIKNSSYAVLRIDFLVENESEQDFSNKKALHFQLVPTSIHPSIIAWHLFARVNERSTEWRLQASFNRLISMFLALSIFLFFIAYLNMVKNRNIEKSKYQDMILNAERERLEDIFPSLSNLELSVWTSNGILCEEIAKTHKQQKNYSIHMDSCLIGYSMNNTDKYFLWTESLPETYIDILNKKEIDGKLYKIGEHAYKSIVAISIDQFGDNEIMGICADIKEGNDSIMRTKEFADELKDILRKYFFSNTK